MRHSRYTGVNLFILWVCSFHSRTPYMSHWLICLTNEQMGFECTNLIILVQDVDIVHNLDEFCSASSQRVT